MARDINIDFEVAGQIEKVELPEWNQLYEAVMDNNTFLQMSFAQNRIASLELRETQSRRMPRLNANAGYSFVNSESESGFIISNRTSGVNYGLALNWNIFNGFNLNRQIANARIMQENAEIELLDYRALLEADLMATWLSMESRIKLAEFEAENLEVADMNLEIAMERFRLGELSGSNCGKRKRITSLPRGASSPPATRQRLWKLS
jgi:outer membrane protein